MALLVLAPSFRVGPLACIGLAISSATGQQFQDVPPTPTGVYLGHADFDGDGFPDLVALRNGGLDLHHNDGHLRFGPGQRVLAGVGHVALTTGDLDGDGDMDIAVVAPTTSPPLRLDVLLLRQAAGTFTTSTIATFAGLVGGAQACTPIDLDSDGDLDLVVTVAAPSPTQLFALRNDGGGVFTDVTSAWFAGIVLPQYPAPSPPAVADVDRDGRTDLLVPTSSGRLLRNTGTQFVDESWRVPLVYIMNPRFGDIDGDGDDDLLTNEWFTAIGAHLWQNQNGTFVDVSATHLPPLVSTTPGVGMMALLDADHDGDLDVAASCGGSAGPNMRMFVNDGTGNLLQQSTIDLGAPFLSTVLLPPPIDLDRDGDIDLLADGPYAGPPVILRGDGRGGLRLPADHLPLPDGETLGYAVDVDGDGDRDLVSSFGVRLFDQGPRWQAPLPFAPNSIPVTSLEQFGDVDGDGDIDLVTRNVARNDGLGNFTVDPTSGFAPTSSATSVLGDFDGDGDLDIVASEGSFPTDSTKFWANHGNGTFAPPVVLYPLGYSRLATGDVDGDGLLDVLTGGGIPTWLRSLGNGTFTAHFIGFYSGRMRTVNLRGAGPLDLLVDGSVWATRLLRQQGGVFVDVTASVFPAGFGAESVAIGDVDGDGDVDLVGPDLLRNDGTGSLTGEPLGLGTAGAMQLADIDGDGDQDLVLTRHVRWNREHQLALPLPPQVGRSVRVDLSARPGRAIGEVAALGLSLARLPTGLPGPLGTLWLARLDGVVLVALPNGIGLTELDLPIPNAPAVVGVEVFLQALHADAGGLALGNLSITHIE